jgi:RNA polymerase sigma factor (sigma-70 family)
MENDEQVLELRKAIDRLPHELKTALLLHHFEHLSYREIAQATGCTERGVETRIYRAKQKLREELVPAEGNQDPTKRMLAIAPQHP